MRLPKLWRLKGVERAAPEIAKHEYEETLARDKVVQEIVMRENSRVVENNFSRRIHRAYGGLR